MTAFGLAELARMDFRTSRSGDTATAAVQRALSFTYRYQPARLALGRSLGIATPPTRVENVDGRAIRGETLFGQSSDEIGLWTSLIIAHAGEGPIGRKRLQELVAAHWARGAGLLWEGLRRSTDPLGDLCAQIARVRG